MQNRAVNKDPVFGGTPCTSNLIPLVQLSRVVTGWYAVISYLNTIIDSEILFLIKFSYIWENESSSLLHIIHFQFTQSAYSRKKLLSIILDFNLNLKGAQIFCCITINVYFFIIACLAILPNDNSGICINRTRIKFLKSPSRKTIQSAKPKHFSQ